MKNSLFEEVDDKVKMKNKILKAGLSVPNFFPFHKIKELNSDDLPDKVILKPVSDSSSNNVYLFSSLSDLKDNLNKDFLKKINLEKNKFEIEEYIDGHIYHFDGIVSNGEILIIQISQYIGTCLDYAHGRHLASLQINDFEKEEIASKYVLASGIENGVFHLEMINSPVRGLVFLEIAPRVGGAGVVDTFKSKYGIDLISIDIALQAGTFKEQEFSTTKSDTLYGWYIEPGHKFPQKKCKVTFGNYDKENIIKIVLPKDDYIFDEKISYNQEEVPIYIIFRYNKHIDCLDNKYHIDKIKESIKIDFI